MIKIYPASLGALQYMAIPRLLKSAPVSEAVIDVQLEIVETKVAELYTEIVSKVGYAKKADMSEKRFEIQLKDGAAVLAASTSKPKGIRLESGNQFVALCREDGFSLSKLAPYSSWEDLLIEFGRIYKIYQSATNPAAVTRLGVRYVNKLPFPLYEIQDFSKLMTYPPQVSAFEGALMAGFLHKTHLFVPDSRTTIKIIQKVEPSSEDLVPLIVDIDAFSINRFDASFPAIKQELAVLRKIKNHYFFDCLTDYALSYFEK